MYVSVSMTNVPSIPREGGRRTGKASSLAQHTYSESEKGEERDGMRTQSPAETPLRTCVGHRWDCYSELLVV